MKVTNIDNDFLRHIFNEADDAVLNYQLDDNQKIEPEWYIPILPMVLVNGADGIGTGWMTKIPNYNPRYDFFHKALGEVINSKLGPIRVLTEDFKCWTYGYVSSATLMVIV